MADCKVLRLPLINDISYLMNGGTIGSQYPEVEAEINKFLSLSYEIKGAFLSMGLVVILERKE